MSNVKLGKIIERILGKKGESKGKSEKKLSDHTVESVKNYHSSSQKISIRSDKIYIKSQTLSSLEDLDSVKDEIISGNIVIVRLGPLAEKSTEDVKKAVSELYDFSQQIGGDIARLGEERIILTPSFIEIWRKKST